MKNVIKKYKHVVTIRKATWQILKYVIHVVVYFSYQCKSYYVNRAPVFPHCRLSIRSLRYTPVRNDTKIIKIFNPVERAQHTKRKSTEERIQYPRLQSHVNSAFTGRHTFTKKIIIIFFNRNAVKQTKQIVTADWEKTECLSHDAPALTHLRCRPLTSLFTCSTRDNFYAIQLFCIVSNEYFRI